MTHYGRPELVRIYSKRGKFLHAAIEEREVSAESWRRRTQYTTTLCGQWLTKATATVAVRGEKPPCLSCNRILKSFLTKEKT